MRPILLHNARWFDAAGDLDAEAVLVEGGVIRALGELNALRALLPAAELIDLEGALVLASLTDTHTHFFEWARRRSTVDLSRSASFDEVERTLAAAARDLDEEPRWVGGSGWDPHFYGSPERFTRHTLDSLFGERPVVLEARDFHTLWCNTAALRLAGLFGASIEVPEGGRVGRADDGTPNGLLYETAWDLVRRARPPESDVVADRWLRRAEGEAHALGLTGVHCMESMATFGHYRRRAASRSSRMRVCFHTPLDDLEDRIGRGEASSTDVDDWLRLGGVKVFMDGSMGSRTAAMSLPYPDGTRGDLLMSEDALDAILARAAQAGIAGTVHAIGDVTVDVVARAFARVRARYGDHLAHRMEHAQCVRPETARVLAEARVYCAVQTVHLRDDLSLLHREWGEAAAHAFALRTLVDAGVCWGLGSDAPVAEPDPRLGIHSAVARRLEASQDAFHPEQCVSPREALAAYTVHAAAAGDYRDRGRIAVGQKADLTAIDDVRDESVDAWLETGIRLTMVDGEVVHDGL